MLRESEVRHGDLPKRSGIMANKQLRRKVIVGVLIYLAIGMWLSKKVFPAWKHNQIRVMLVWPLLVVVRVLIGKFN